MRGNVVKAVAVLAVVGFCGVGKAEEKIAPKTLEFLEATTISGYVEASYVYNTKEGIINGSHGSGTAAGVNVLRCFDNNAGFTLNAVKLVLEKPLGEGDWAAGYRADLMFGQDPTVMNTVSTSTISLGSGGIVEQGYVNFRVPVGNGLEFKFGKFVTMSGYEVIESPANLNFSRSLLFTWAIPLFHTGLSASYKFNDLLDAQLCIVNGWNNNVDNNAEPQLHWRVGYTAPKGVFTFATTGTYGRDINATATGTAERWLVDLVSTWNVTEKFTLGGNFDYGHQTSAGDVNPSGVVTKIIPADWWGAAGYAQLKPNDKVNFVLRGEYYDDIDGFTTIGGLGGAGATGGGGVFGQNLEVWELTGTANFNIWKNLLTRLEVRYDNANLRVFNKLHDQLTFAADAVYSF